MNDQQSSADPPPKPRELLADRVQPYLDSRLHVVEWLGVLADELRVVAAELSDPDRRAGWSKPEMQRRIQHGRRRLDELHDRYRAAWRDALRVGWTPRELRDLGLPEPVAPRRPGS